jgi:signal transduction histidine kinase
MDELRDLAHGIYPLLLTSIGLTAALRSAGLRSGRAVTVQASGVRRCRPEFEIAVYFTCLAAVGGKLAIDTAAARGMRVHGSVPDPGWR